MDSTSYRIAYRSHSAALTTESRARLCLYRQIDLILERSAPQI